MSGRGTPKRRTKSTASDSARSDAARRGWETRRAAAHAREVAIARRSAAARAGWESRRQELAERKAIVGDKRTPDYEKRRDKARGKRGKARRARVDDYLQQMADETGENISDLYDLYYGYTDD
jgi:hypothetical protein